MNPKRFLGSNDKEVKPEGFGPQGFIARNEMLTYEIFFENVDTATAEAINIEVTDTLDSNLDLFTLTIGPMSHNGEVTIDSLFGIIKWTFKNINLPPNKNPPEGEGWVTFLIQPKMELSSGTTIRNKATIVFDFNPPISTGEVYTTIDALPPSSQVTVLPDTTRSTEFTLHWWGEDDSLGSGIKDYTIYVSEDGGVYKEWLTTSDTTATFTGKDHHTYSFYSISQDNVGNIESTPVGADAQTIVMAIPKFFFLSQNHPNPFAGSTIIEYGLPVDTPVNLTIYDIQGRRVRELVKGVESAGYKQAIWNGKDNKGKKVANGIYFYRLKAGGFTKVKRMVLIR